MSDKVKISGPRIDGTMVVSFEVGEYEKHKIKDLLDIPSDQAVRVNVGDETNE